MHLEEGLFKYLKTAIPNASIYGLLRGPALPAVIYTLISDPVSISVSAVDQIHETRYQIDVYTRKYLQSKQLAHQVVRALHNRINDLGGYPIQRVLLENTQDSFEENAKLHRQIMTFVIYHNGETP